MLQDYCRGCKEKNWVVLFSIIAVIPNFKCWQNFAVIYRFFTWLLWGGRYGGCPRVWGIRNRCDANRNPFHFLSLILHTFLCKIWMYMCNDSCTVLYSTRLTPGKLNVSWSVFHLPKNSRNPVWDVNETRLFGSLHWKLFGINRISEKVVPFSSKLPNGICVPFTDFSSLSPVQYLTRSFKRPGLPGLPWMELVTNGTRFPQTEIPNRNFPKFVLNGKCPCFLSAS